MVDKQIIRQELERFLVMEGDYTIHDDGTITSWGDVNAIRAMDKMPFKFRLIAGHLYLANSNLKSLENSPSEVGGNLWAHNNKIPSLIGMPQKVYGNVSLERNPLISLEGLSLEIGGWVEVTYSPNLPLLRTLVAKSGPILRLPEGPSDEIERQRDEVETIMLRYQGQGKRPCLIAKKNWKMRDLKEMPNGRQIQHSQNTHKAFQDHLF